MSRAISLRELLEKEILSTPYYCVPLLPVGGRMVIGAPPKMKKSLLALNFAYSMAEGEPVLGLWQTARPLCVLIVEQEIGELRLKERAGRIQRFRGGGLAPDNLYLISKDLEIQIDTKRGLEILVQEIEKVKPHVVILDPLRKMHQQKEEDSQQMVYLFRCLEQIQKQFALGMILVHHTTKRSEFRNLSNPESLRGSGEIFADVDTAIMLEQPVQNRPERLRLHITLRSDKNPEPVLVTMDPETFWFTVDAKKVAEEL